MSDDETGNIQNNIIKPQLNITTFEERSDLETKSVWKCRSEVWDVSPSRPWHPNSYNSHLKVKSKAE